MTTGDVAYLVILDWRPAKKMSIQIKILRYKLLFHTNDRAWHTNELQLGVGELHVYD